MSVKIYILSHCYRRNEQERQHIKCVQIAAEWPSGGSGSQQCREQRLNSDIFSYPRLLVPIICISKNAIFTVQD